MNSLKVKMEAQLSVHGELDMTSEAWTERVLALNSKALRRMWRQDGQELVELVVMGSPDEDLEPGQALLSIDSVSLVVDVDTLIRALKPFRAPK